MAAVTVFVNGIFNPRSEAEWATRRTALERIFGCPAHHVHNPTLDVEVSQERALGAIKKNQGLAMAFGVFAMGAVALDARLKTGLAEKTAAAAMDSVRSSLQQKADSVAVGLEREIGELAASSKATRVNLVAHSHGGWVTKSLLEAGGAARLAAEYNIKLHVFVLGCPVLVPAAAPGVANTTQLHNTLDPISLRYTPASAIAEKHVVGSEVDSYHEFNKYVEWLESFVGGLSVVE